MASNPCFVGSGRIRALRRNLEPVMPRPGAPVPPGPRFGEAGTLSATGLAHQVKRRNEQRKSWTTSEYKSIHMSDAMCFITATRTMAASKRGWRK
jgi:hypothetical protein